MSKHLNAPDLQLKAVHNKKMGQWKICHNQWCDPGETSVVAVVISSLDEAADEAWANLICERFNRGG